MPVVMETISTPTYYGKDNKYCATPVYDII